MKSKIKIKGLSHQESLLMIRDARIEGHTAPEIAQKLNITFDDVFKAHIILMKQKLLAWKPIVHDIITELPDPNNIDPKTKKPVITSTVKHELEIRWYVPMKKNQPLFKFNFKRTKGGKKDGK